MGLRGTLSSCPVLALSTVQSLDWETFEQYSTWQLFLAHSIPLETIIPILQHLKYKGMVLVQVWTQHRKSFMISPRESKCLMVSLVFLSTEHPEALSCLLLQLRREKYAVTTQSVSASSVLVNLFVHLSVQAQ